MSDLKDFYKKNIVPELQKLLGKNNPLTVPQLKKIVVSVSTKEILGNKKVLENIASELTSITGQKPKITRARKSISAFKLREGQEIGLMVTLRGKRMYDFFEKLVTIVLPRVRDFKGVSKDAFDKQGNFNLGFKEQIVFPEIDPGKIDKIRGLQVTIVTTAKNNKEGAILLEKMGMPFTRNQDRHSLKK